MKKLLPLAPLLALSAAPAFAGLITAVPGPDDQGGMLMPMVTITGADNNSNPTTGTVSVSFAGGDPVFKSLQDWSPGSWFSDTAAWRIDLGSAAGVGGTPGANAGSGALFNNQYGFMFMAMPMMGAANLPTGKSLGIQLTAVSSPELESYNYVNAQNRWDEVFADVGDQVLWNGSMWHNYFVVPADAAAGEYSATFEIFIADAAFIAGTGFVNYDSAALAAARDPNFTPATVTYTWTVAAIPEPSAYALLVGGGALGLAVSSRRRRAAPASARG